MRVRLRFDPHNDRWIVESKQWFNLQWQYEQGYWAYSATLSDYEQAKRFAYRLKNPLFEEII